MELTSEQVHWIGGAAFSAIALLLLAREMLGLSAGWWAYLIPLLFIGYGLESLVDLWVHGSAVPANYGRESRQHLLQGGPLLVGGIVQWNVARGRLRGWWWQLAVPLALVALAVGFAMHDQHGASETAMLLMATQHRAFAIVLGLAAAARFLRVLPATSHRVPEATWLVPLLGFGLLMLTYRETMAPMTHG
jgi:hypothetical protein